MIAVSVRPEPLPLAAAPDLLRRHIETVSAPIGDEANRIETELISHSWRRCAELHRIDPESLEPPRILSESALRLSKEPIERVVHAAQAELDRLHRIVGHAGYVTLLCDIQGVAIDHRGSEARSAEFRHWGIWLGGVWAEAVEGTNGIGTCIADHRAVTVHRTQHFRSRLVAVLDVSSMEPRLSAQAHPLTLPLVVNSARQMEERLFRERFSHAWIIAVAPPGGSLGCAARCRQGAPRDRRGSLRPGPIRPRSARAGDGHRSMDDLLAQQCHPETPCTF
jgi:transcriptional regulator of acetoin/glycerol metabolism